MKKHISATYNHIHIINLEHTLIGLRRSCEFVHNLAKNRNKLLLVGTKRAASDIVKQQAISINQFYVNHRWMGGMLTNYKTVCSSIDKLKELNKESQDGSWNKLTKKEGLARKNLMIKLEKSIGGIKDMDGLPDALFVIDIRFERIAVLEAKKLGIPVIAIVDTNSNPKDANFIIPGNDDSTRAIELYVSTIVTAFSNGMKLADELSMKRKSQREKALKKEEAPTRIEGTLKRTKQKAKAKEVGAKVKPDQTQQEADSQKAQPKEVGAKVKPDQTQQEAGSQKAQTKEVGAKVKPDQAQQEASSQKAQPKEIDAKLKSDQTQQEAGSPKQDKAGSQINVNKVKELRQKTGAGIMECKEMLQQANGDIEAAADLLRKAGRIKALKKTGREAKEGLFVAKVSEDNSFASLMEINCETDFVARNEKLGAVAQKLITEGHKNRTKNPADILVEGSPLEEEFQQLVQQLSENIQVAGFYHLDAPEGGTVAAYVHSNNRIAALVAIDKQDQDLCHNLALQVAAMEPLATTPDEMPPAILAKEEAIYREQVKDSGKPPEIQDKMVKGMLAKFIAMNTLSEQAFIKDTQTKISSLLTKAEVKKLSFVRRELGQQDSP